MVKSLFQKHSLKILLQLTFLLTMIQSQCCVSQLVPVSYFYLTINVALENHTLYQITNSDIFISQQPQLVTNPTLNSSDKNVLHNTTIKNKDGKSMSIYFYSNHDRKYCFKNLDSNRLVCSERTITYVIEHFNPGTYLICLSDCTETISATLTSMSLSNPNFRNRYVDIVYLWEGNNWFGNIQVKILPDAFKIAKKLKKSLAPEDLLICLKGDFEKTNPTKKKKEFVELIKKINNDL